MSSGPGPSIWQKEAEGIGAQNQIGSLVLSPALIEWKERKMRNVEELWLVIVPFPPFFLLETLSFGVQDSS